MRLLFFKIYFLLYCLTLFSQNKNLENSYNEYFEITREIPHLHLNKTTFLSGEDIWFKSYVLEQNSQKLHKTTSNLYVSIFDDEGNLKDQKLIRVTNGMGIGSIKVDSTFTKETYFLKASTNWMKNFHEDNSYIQKIKIVSNAKNKSSNNFTQDKFYEFKLFPEGGHILGGSINNFGVLIKDKNNKGITIDKGFVKNSKGDIIKEFKTNKFGLGDVNFYFHENEVYSFEATLDNGVVISQKTSISNIQGIAMRVVNSNPNNLFIKIRTNENSIKNLASKTYTIFIHNTRKYQKQELTFNGIDTKYSLIINKGKLAKGVNTITVFNEDFKPVLERIIYNHKEELYSDINIDKISSTADSLTVQIKNKGSQKLYLSSSFLPSQTKAYANTNNVYSSFMFRPYLKGDIQNIDYYIKDINHKKLRDLDLLLLTQGWSKYSWNNIFDYPPNTNYNFENGITITGKLNKALKKDQQLVVFSSENDIIEVLTPNNGSFKLPNTYVLENSNIEFGITNKNGITLKASPSLQFTNRSSFENLSDTFLEKKEIDYQLNYQIVDLKSTFRENEILDEVEIKKKRDRTDFDEAVLDELNFPVRKFNIEADPSTSVLDVLRKKYHIYYKDAIPFPIISSRGGTITNSFRGTVEVYLDDDKIYPSPLATILEQLPINTIKGIYYGEKNKYSPYVGHYPVEYVYIYSYSPGEYKTSNSSLGTYKVKKGFSQTKDYYSPEFKTYSTETFLHYGSVFWIPEISIAPNSVKTFKIPTKLQEEIRMYLEGVSESGSLISKKTILK